MTARRLPARLAALAIAVVAAGVGLLTAPAPNPLMQSPKLDAVLAMSEREADSYFAEHPEIALELLNSDPNDVADWWHGLSRDDKGDMLRLAPELVGNLGGIDFATRDRANRAHLAEAITTAKAAVARNLADPLEAANLTALKAIRGTLKKKTSPHRYLVSLTDNKPPLAAVAIGNLDTATLVTFAVPGMGTYTTDMQLWTQSAQNVYDEQGNQGEPGGRATVAWIGYITPPPGVDAALGGYAARGAPLLVNAIDGLYAAREKKEPTYVNVVAHSYGTTVSANALASANLRIYSFVMLGSAGIEASIPGARALHAKYVYAGEATSDEKARWGRVSRQDPRSTTFGAWSLAVDGDPVLGLAGVTGHEPVLHSAWNDVISSPKWTAIKDAATRKAQFAAHKAAFGYLDAGTQSLVNVARATIPRPFQDVTPAVEGR